MTSDASREHTIESLERYTDVTYEAVELFNEGDYDGAIGRLRKMARVNPDNIKVHEVLADGYLRLGLVDLAADEMATIRRIAARLYPDLALDAGRTFDELAAEAIASDELESRVAELFRSRDAAEMARHTGVVSQLGVKLMAAGNYVAAERVLQQYSERLAALREGSPSARESRGD